MKVTNGGQRVEYEDKDYTHLTLAQIQEDMALSNAMKRDKEATANVPDSGQGHGEDRGSNVGPTSGL